MNNDTRKIYRLAPDIYEENETMLEVYKQENLEIDEFELMIARVFLNNFVKTCNEEGIKRFEKIFKILADEINESLEYRKARIINKFTSQLPYTKIFLQQMLEGIFGIGMYEINILNNIYKIKINVETSIQGLADQTFKDLREIIPANLIIERLVLQPYVHGYIRKYYSHEDLQQFTYGELSQYA